MKHEIDVHGIAVRQARMDGDVRTEEYRLGMLQALGDVLVHHGEDPDEVGDWINAARGFED